MLYTVSKLYETTSTLVRVCILYYIYVCIIYQLATASRQYLQYCRYYERVDDIHHVRARTYSSNIIIITYYYQSIIILCMYVRVAHDVRVYYESMLCTLVYNINIQAHTLFLRRTSLFTSSSYYKQVCILGIIIYLLNKYESYA